CSLVLYCPPNRGNFMCCHRRAGGQAMSKYDAYLEQHRETHVQQLLDFLRIPSVSALPRHKDDVRRAAQWAADHLRAIGVPKVEILETSGHPIVYGEWNGRLTPTSPRTSSTATSTCSRWTRSTCGKTRSLNLSSRTVASTPGAPPTTRDASSWR